MYFPNTNRSLSFLFLVIVLIGCGGLIALSAPAPATSNRGAGSPFRLRLHAKPSTLPSGEGTSVWAEFLDRDYNPVPSDGDRVIQFAVPRGSGSFTKPAVTVKAGEWPGGTWFTTKTQGRVVITASSDPLESDQTLLIVTQKEASWFSQLTQLFETVAYADPPASFEFSTQSNSVSAGEKSRIKFELSWLPAPAQDTEITISTNPSVKIIHNGKEFSGSAPVVFLKGSSKPTDAIQINSTIDKTVSVTATSPDGTELAKAEAKFTKPRLHQIIFDAEPIEIPPSDNRFPITLKLVDDGGNDFKGDQEIYVSLSTGNTADDVDFYPESVPVLPQHSWAESTIVVKKLAERNVLKLWARSAKLKSGDKTIHIRTPIDGVEIRDVPPEITFGEPGKQVSVVLVDKPGGNLVPADKVRTINLTTTNGTLTAPGQVTIPTSECQVKFLKGESMQRVLVTPSDSGSKATVTARSEGFADSTARITLVAAAQWLVFWALVGGLIGGIVRHIPGDFRLQRIVPRWTGEYWDLGFAGRLFGSIVGGLLLFLIFRYGIHRLLGSPELPEALNLGSKLVAFFIGVPGGFAGIYVLRRFAGWLLPGSGHQTAEGTT